MIRIITTSGLDVLTGAVSVCTVGGVVYLVHDAGQIRAADVQSIEVVAS